MKLRGYIGVVVLVLTLVGLVCQQEYTLPNQEIVLEFTDAELASDEAQNAIAVVQEQLLELGAENIQVKEDVDGRLKITYYSTSDVASIKESFSRSHNLILGYTTDDNEHNSSSDSTPYNLDIFEITDGNELDWNLHGNQVVEIKTEPARSLLPIIFKSCSDIEEKLHHNWVKQILETQFSVSLSIEYNAGNIPDVRAGPIT